jgi:TonB family protein
MQPLPQPAPPTQNPARFGTQFNTHSGMHFGALSMTVAWEPRGKVFRSSLRAFFTGPRVPKREAVSGGDHLRVEWVESKLPGRAFTASSLWHVAAVGLLLLPIWGFLPSMQPKIAPTQVVLTWDAAQDLPQISLPAPAPKPKLPAPPRAEIPDPAPEPDRGADAYHPRQTILSIPLHITHPRQTLIQPNAPATPPKIDQPQPQMVFTAKVAAPKVKTRDVQDVAAPDIVNQEKTPGPLNIASAPVVNPAPQMALSSMSAAVAQQRPVRTQNTAAPELAPEPSSGDASLRRVIALSTAPAPPAPVAALPQGNLAARISISPEGAKPGTPGGADRPSGSGAGSQGASVSAGGARTNGAGSNSLPASVSISGGNRNGAGGKLNLDPKSSLPSRPDAMNSLRTGPSVVGNIDPSISPDKILSGKEVYTMHIDMPNLTSASGSWILNFAQLDERAARSAQPQARLAAPVLERKVDPKYPPAFIKAHVEGQVILYAIIRKDGSVDSIQRVRGLEPQLDQNAMDAFAQWKFSPATRDGAPVDVEAVVFIPFRFRGPAE